MVTVGYRISLIQLSEQALRYDLFLPKTILYPNMKTRALSV
jgi:hypothetical protein